jgi:hypothetical protein
LSIDLSLMSPAKELFGGLSSFAWRAAFAMAGIATHKPMPVRMGAIAFHMISTTFR